MMNSDNRESEEYGACCMEIIRERRQNEEGTSMTSQEMEERDMEEKTKMVKGSGEYFSHMDMHEQGMSKEKTYHRIQTKIDEGARSLCGSNFAFPNLSDGAKIQGKKFHSDEKMEKTLSWFNIDSYCLPKNACLSDIPTASSEEWLRGNLQLALNDMKPSSSSSTQHDNVEDHYTPENLEFLGGESSDDIDMSLPPLSMLPRNIQVQKHQDHKKSRATRLTLDETEMQHLSQNTSALMLKTRAATSPGIGYNGNQIKNFVHRERALDENVKKHCPEERLDFSVRRLNMILALICFLVFILVGIIAISMYYNVMLTREIQQLNFGRVEEVEKARKEFPESHLKFSIKQLLSGKRGNFTMRIPSSLKEN